LFCGNYCAISPVDIIYILLLSPSSINSIEETGEGSRGRNSVVGTQHETLVI
jgi:hypothetical protein